MTDSQQTKVKTFDLMNGINSRGTFVVTKAAVPHLLKSAEANRNPHVLTFAPPLRGNLTPESFASATAYAMAKFGMSLATLGFAGELKGKVGVNALWPLTYISTEAIRLILSEEGRQQARDPSFIGEVSYAMLQRDGRTYSGKFEIDELFVRNQAGWNSKKLDEFAVVPMNELHEDLYIPQWVRDEVASLREKDTTATLK